MSNVPIAWTASFVSPGLAPGASAPFSALSFFPPGGTTPAGGDGSLGFYASGVLPTPIPEPGTMSLLALGGLALVRRRHAGQKRSDPRVMSYTSPKITTS